MNNKFKRIEINIDNIEHKTMLSANVIEADIDILKTTLKLNISHSKHHLYGQDNIQNHQFN